VRDWQDTSSSSPDNPLNYIDALQRTIVMPVLSFLSITFVGHTSLSWMTYTSM
jgi:hypothetical protein